MAKQPTQKQENTKGAKGSFSAGASPMSAAAKQAAVSVSTGGGGGDGGGFLSRIFGGGNNDLSQRDWARGPGGASMDVITKPYVGGKTSPNYGQVNLGMAAPGTPGLTDKLALSAAAQAAASQPQGIMGVLGNLMPGAMAGRAITGFMKHMRPRSEFAPRYGVDGQLTNYGQLLADRQAASMAQMAEQSRLENDPSYGPSSNDLTPPAIDPTQIPGERPPWWPSYLPWPPVPNASDPAAPATPATPAAPAAPSVGTQPTGSLPAPTPYGTSYSSLQNAISGARNPLTMGIGGMLRRP